MSERQQRNSRKPVKYGDDSDDDFAPSNNRSKSERKDAKVQKPQLKRAKTDADLGKAPKLSLERVKVADRVFERAIEVALELSKKDSSSDSKLPLSPSEFSTVSNQETVLLDSEDSLTDPSLPNDVSTEVKSDTAIVEQAFRKARSDDAEESFLNTSHSPRKKWKGEKADSGDGRSEKTPDSSKKKSEDVKARSDDGGSEKLPDLSRKKSKDEKSHGDDGKENFLKTSDSSKKQLKVETTGSDGRMFEKTTELSIKNSKVKKADSDDTDDCGVTYVETSDLSRKKWKVDKDDSGDSGDTVFARSSRTVSKKKLIIVDSESEFDESESDRSDSDFDETAAVKNKKLEKLSKKKVSSKVVPSVKKSSSVEATGVNGQLANKKVAEKMKVEELVKVEAKKTRKPFPSGTLKPQPAVSAMNAPGIVSALAASLKAQSPLASTRAGIRVGLSRSSKVKPLHPSLHM